MQLHNIKRNKNKNNNKQTNKQLTVRDAAVVKLFCVEFK